MSLRVIGWMWGEKCDALTRILSGHSPWFSLLIAGYQTTHILFIKYSPISCILRGDITLADGIMILIKCKIG